MAVMAPRVDVGLAAIFVHCQTLDRLTVTLQGEEEQGELRPPPLGPWSAFPDGRLSIRLAMQASLHGIWPLDADRSKPWPHSGA